VGHGPRCRAALLAAGLGRWARGVASGAAALVRPFTPDRFRKRHREMHQFATPYRYNHAAYATAMGAFVLDRTARTWEGWWRDPRARLVRVHALATVAPPALAAAATAQSLLGRREGAGPDLVSPLIRSAFSRERLAAALPERAQPEADHGADYDVLVIGGGPAG